MASEKKSAWSHPRSPAWVTGSAGIVYKIPPELKELEADYRVIRTSEVLQTSTHKATSSANPGAWDT